MAKMTESDVQRLRERIRRSCRGTSSSPGMAVLEALAESVPFAPGSKEARYSRLEDRLKAFLDWCYYDRSPEERAVAFADEGDEE